MECRSLRLASEPVPETEPGGAGILDFACLAASVSGLAQLLSRGAVGIGQSPLQPQSGEQMLDGQAKGRTNSERLFCAGDVRAVAAEIPSIHLK